MCSATSPRRVHGNTAGDGEIGFDELFEFMHGKVIIGHWASPPGVSLRLLPCLQLRGLPLLLLLLHGS